MDRDMSEYKRQYTHTQWRVMHNYIVGHDKRAK